MTIRTQTRYPGTVVSDDSNGGTVPWSDPEKAKVEDNDPATATGPGISHFLKATGYDFALLPDAEPLFATPKPRRRGGGSAPVWTVIGSQTLESAAASVSFPGISTTYRMFRVTLFMVKDTTTGEATLRINNDSGTNYDYQALAGGGTAVSAARFTGQTSISVSNGNVLSGELVTSVIVIAKQVSGSAAMVLIDTVRRGGSNLEKFNAAGRWNNTDLINRIDLLSSSGNFAAGTTVVLEAC